MGFSQRNFNLDARKISARNLPTMNERHRKEDDSSQASKQANRRRMATELATPSAELDSVSHCCSFVPSFLVGLFIVTSLCVHIYRQRIICASIPSLLRPFWRRRRRQLLPLLLRQLRRSHLQVEASSRRLPRSRHRRRHLDWRRALSNRRRGEKRPARGGNPSGRTDKESRPTNSSCRT